MDRAAGQMARVHHLANCFSKVIPGLRGFGLGKFSTGSPSFKMKECMDDECEDDEGVLHTPKPY